MVGVGGLGGHGEVSNESQMSLNYHRGDKIERLTQWMLRC